MADCIVCRGQKIIRLPLFHPLEVSAVDVPAIDTVPSHRDYPCPECKELSAPYSRLWVASSHSEVPAYLRDRVGIVESFRNGLAAALGGELHRKGMISFRESAPDHRGIIIVQATVGVVAPDHVADLETRVASRQFEVAEALIGETAAQIANWGSSYGSKSVPKDAARSWLREAFEKVKARYGGKRG